MTSSFPCPSCGRAVCVSVGYRRALGLLALVLGLLVPYALGVRSIFFLFILWTPCSILVQMALAYLLKYAVPPQIESHASPYSGPLGLGRK